MKNHYNFFIVIKKNLDNFMTIKVVNSSKKIKSKFK